MEKELRLEDVALLSPTKIRDGVHVYSPDLKSVSAFGLQWEEFSQVQLDSRNGFRISEERLNRVLGEDLDYFSGKLVLEVGCGCGRFTEIMLKYGARVVCVDASSAIYACNKNIGSRQDVLFIQGDALDLPLRRGIFDIVVCLGVIQHTKLPEKMIKECFSFAKVGGSLLFDQYRLALPTLLRTTWLIRPFLKRLSPATGIKVTNKMVEFLLPIHKKLIGKPLVEKLLFRVSPITAHYSSIPQLSESEQIQWARLNTHDNLTDYYKRLTWKAQLRKRILGLGNYFSKVRILPYTFEVRLDKVKSEVPLIYFSNRFNSRDINSA